MVFPDSNSVLLEPAVQTRKSSGSWSPDISVIIPVYNGAQVIAACLESLLNQNYPSNAYEIIVVNNASTDSTAQVVEKYPVRLLYCAQRGPSAARNYGIAHSSPSIVAFTDDDCIASPGWLSSLASAYADPTVVGAGGPILAYQRENASPVEIFSHQYSPLINYISGEAEYLPHLYTANASYRKALVDRVGGFNARLLTAEDVDLAWRIQINTGSRLQYVPEAVVYHRHRVTAAGLARQYRLYGYGEILLDTLYQKNPRYPRNLPYQYRRIMSQFLALPRYVASFFLRRIRLGLGRSSQYDALVPWLWLRIESSNLRGKVEGLLDTRFMTDASQVMNSGSQPVARHMIRRGRE